MAFSFWLLAFSRKSEVTGPVEEVVQVDSADVSRYAEGRAAGVGPAPETQERRMAGIDVFEHGKSVVLAEIGNVQSEGSVVRTAGSLDKEALLVQEVAQGFRASRREGDRPGRPRVRRPRKEVIAEEGRISQESLGSCAV